MTDEIRDISDQFEHGGNIYRLAEELKIQERKVIDFSASVNPIGVSKKIKAEIRKHLKYLHNYPDHEAKRLRKRIAQQYGIEQETILCGNGSTELIHLIARALRPRKVLIPSPTFLEYERAVSIQQTPYSSRYSEDNKQFIEYLLLKNENGFEISPDVFIEAMQGHGNPESITQNSALSDTPCDMAFLCNPNNPTGRLLRREDVKKIADAAKELSCRLIVDEAFIDFCPDDSVIRDVGYNPYLIVLRTMTHFFALSGLRIGYGIFPRHLVNSIKDYQEPWTVNSLAQRAAVVALKDKVYKNTTFKFIHEEKKFLEKSFRKIGIGFFPSDTNFYLLKLSNAQEICRQLRSKGILIRDCSHFRGLDSSYIRVAVKSRKENSVLIKELTAILQPPSVPPYQEGN